MSGGIVVVSGGASGIGARLTESLAADYDVIVIDRAAAPEAVPGVEYLEADVTSETALARTAEAIAQRGPVSALVHCAGVMTVGPFLDAEPAQWRRVIDVNVAGTLATCQAFGPLLSDGGRIVLFSSGTVFKGPGGVAAYAASKAAVIGFARSLAMELGSREITVNVVVPAWCARRCPT